MLEKNENPYPPQIDWNKCLSMIDLNRYPDSGYATLKSKLSKFLKVNTSQLSLGNGSDEVLQSTIFALTELGEEVLSFAPTFSEYKRICDLRGSSYKEIVLEAPFEPDMDLLKNYITAQDPKLIILCNPNNPTGRVLERSKILDLLSWTKAFVIVDEAYIDFGGESLLSYVKDYKNLVVLRTFSKGYGLAALRFGFAIASPEIIEQIESKRAPYNLNQLTASAVLELLDNLNPILENIEKIKAERDRIQNQLINSRIPFIKSSSNFVLFKPKNKMALEDELSRTSLSLRFFKDPILESFARFSIGTSEQNNALLAILGKSMKGDPND